MPEDSSQYFVSCDFAGDGAEVVEGVPQVLCYEDCGRAGVESRADASEGFGGAAEGVVMARVGHEDGVRGV